MGYVCVGGGRGAPSSSDLRPISVPTWEKERKKAQRTTGAQHTLGSFLFRPFKH